VFVRQFAVAEAHDGNQWDFNPRWVGGIPGSIQGISCVWVKEKIISSTSWFSPTVREIGVSVVSGGMLGMKSRE
jgi:hypothetical protein